MAGRRSTDERRKSHQWGRWAELVAALVLMSKAYWIVERRYKSPVGEIDIVARKGRVYVFIEVKARATIADAAQSISSHQRARIVRAAQHWISQNPGAAGADMRFDAILIGRGLALRHLKDAFDA